MKPIINGILASIAALGLLSACGSDSKSAVPTTVTVSADSIPQAALDLYLAQLEASGLKIDKACFTALLKDESLRKLVATGGGTPTQEAIAKFVSCFKQ